MLTRPPVQLPSPHNSGRLLLLFVRPVGTPPGRAAYCSNWHSEVFKAVSKLLKVGFRNCMSRENQHLYEFGPFRLDPQRRQLRRGDTPVSLTPKAFETLLVLVENRNRVVLKDDLMKTLWPDSFVEES